jgi:hypothetical protein
MGSEVATAIRKLRPEFSHLETHPFVHDEVEAGPSTQLPNPIEATIASTRPVTLSREGQNAGPSRTNKFHFWYIGVLPHLKTLITRR